MNINTVTPVEKSATRGRLDVEFDNRDKQTIVKSIYEQHPLRLLRPTGNEDVKTGVILNTSGGIVGGDEFGITVRSGSQTKVCLTSQAAEKVYRSSGPDAHLNIEMFLGQNSWTEWLPHETILFNASCMRRSFKVQAAPSAQLLAGDLVVFGRTAMNERLTRGLFHDEWAIRIAERLVWCDAFLLQDDMSVVLQAPAGCNGATSMGLLIYVGPNAADHLERARQLANDNTTDATKCGATCLDQILIMRFLSTKFGDLRNTFENAWCVLRHEISSLPAKPPKNWTL